ncbi:MAG: hypothetical protein VB101_13115 [Rhodospirillaceae bacterium]|nr:hypothetical protein [Rhodospirillaceae bacterium]
MALGIAAIAVDVCPAAEIAGDDTARQTFFDKREIDTANHARMLGVSTGYALFAVGRAETADAVHPQSARNRPTVGGQPDRLHRIGRDGIRAVAGAFLAGGRTE